ncbi:MAG: helix-turn-helix domain-containing protein, partial [Defluviicoccus sp.]|nr:helix-turn-helix domain-containing protein [Defluviicoccus sp.]
GVVTPLSSGEFRLLAALLERPGMVLSRDQLLDLTRGRSAAPFDRAVDNQVSRLRRKIERDPKNPALIATVWGGGYRFAGKVERG